MALIQELLKFTHWNSQKYECLQDESSKLSGTANESASNTHGALIRDYQINFLDIVRRDTVALYSRAH
jgi:hypothetical protein